MGSQGPFYGQTKTRRKMAYDRHPEDKRRYNEATRKLKNQIRRVKEETFRTHLHSLTSTADTGYALWKAVRRSKRRTQSIPPIRSADQISDRNDKEEANTFAGHLEKTFKRNELPRNEDLETEINKALKVPLQRT
jgi:hypothetical protein